MPLKFIKIALGHPPESGIEKHLKQSGVSPPKNRRTAKTELFQLRDLCTNQKNHFGDSSGGGLSKFAQDLQSYRKELWQIKGKPQKRVDNALLRSVRDGNLNEHFQLNQRFVSSEAPPRQTTVKFVPPHDRSLHPQTEGQDIPPKLRSEMQEDSARGDQAVDPIIKDPWVTIWRWYSPPVHPDAAPWKLRRDGQLTSGSWRIMEFDKDRQQVHQIYQVLPRNNSNRHDFLTDQDTKQKFSWFRVHHRSLSPDDSQS